MAMLQSGETSIQDVLKFKHALSSLDDTIPFGESFGKATGRDEAIDCAHRIYHMLLNCSPGAKVLPFEVLAWISFDEKDVQDEAKLKALRRLFHPDARNNLTLFAFVQVNELYQCEHLHPTFVFFDRFLAMSFRRVVIWFTSVFDISKPLWAMLQLSTMSWKKSQISFIGSC